MKSWAAGVEIAGGTSATDTVASSASDAAPGVANVGPQLAMPRHAPGAPGIGHDPHGGIGAFACDVPPAAPW